MPNTLNTHAIQDAMDASGLNAANLANKIGVSRESVSKWLKGESYPRPDKLLKLALTLQLKREQIIQPAHPAIEPIIAFRKRGTTKTTERHKSNAREMGYLLKPLVEYLPFDQLIGPATLKQPSQDYAYLQNLVTEIRLEMGVGAKEEITYRHLIKSFQDMQTVLIPVLWGVKDRHENALHIFLPDSKTTWIYLNLDSEAHDFKFWMAHELGHVLAPDLRDDKGEDFADAFAGLLLFPDDLAKEAYEYVHNTRNPGARMNRIKEKAEQYTISPITVYAQMNHFANYNGLPAIDLGESIYGAASNLNKQYMTISETLFDSDNPLANQYIELCKREFDSPFFDALKTYLIQHDKSASYIQSILDIPYTDAKAIHTALI